MGHFLCFGEPLLRLSPPDFLRFAQTHQFNLHFAGAEYNTAYALARWQHQVKYVSKIPANEVANLLVQQMMQAGIHTDGMVYGGKRMGIYYLEEGSGPRSSIVVYDREHTAFAEALAEDFDWAALFKNIGWFHTTGITPALSHNMAEVCRQALQTAMQLGLTTSMDLNYRSKLWQYGKTPAQVMPGLMQHCRVVLGDYTTVEQYFGIAAGGQNFAAQCAASMHALRSTYPALRHVVYSFRHGSQALDNTIGAYLLCDAGFFESRSFHLSGMIERLGSGDAMMAGLLHALQQPSWSPQQCIDFAVAAAAIKSTIRGDVCLASAAEIARLAAGAGTGRIDR